MKICGTGSNISFIPDPYMSPFIKTPDDDVKEKHGVLKGF